MYNVEEIKYKRYAARIQTKSDITDIANWIDYC
jgi:hypothetical protein